MSEVPLYRGYAFTARATGYTRVCAAQYTFIYRGYAWWLHGHPAFTDLFTHLTSL